MKIKNSDIKQHGMMTRGMLVILMVVLSISTVYGHRMMIDPVEDGKVWVGYEDGTSIDNITVQVLDEEGEVLREESVDEEGLYSFENEPNAHSILADDGMGHRVTWVVGEPRAYREGWRKYIRILGIVVVFILIAIFFQRRGRKSRESMNSLKTNKNPDISEEERSK